MVHVTVLYSAYERNSCTEASEPYVEHWAMSINQKERSCLMSRLMFMAHGSTLSWCASTRTVLVHKKPRYSVLHCLYCCSVPESAAAVHSVARSSAICFSVALACARASLQARIQNPSCAHWLTISTQHICPARSGTQ